MAAIQFESLCKYKYRLLAELRLKCGLRGYYARTEYIEIRDDGTLILRKGYAWDGATCCPDVPEIMRGSAGHDALYQLISIGAIPGSKRFHADFDLYRWCKEDGMTEELASAVLSAVRAFGGLHV